jgi:hypothetical protein
MPGEDIHVYNNSWTEVLSLVSDDPQYFYALVWNSLLIDIWTSASQRNFAIYDIPRKLKIFESTYHCSNTCLTVSGNIVQFYYKIWNEYDGQDKRPVDAPSCTWLDNGYVETRSFDLQTKTTQESWIFTCAYFE